MKCWRCGRELGSGDASGSSICNTCSMTLPFRSYAARSTGLNAERTAHAETLARAEQAEANCEHCRLALNWLAAEWAQRTGQAGLAVPEGEVQPEDQGRAVSPSPNPYSAYWRRATWTVQARICRDQRRMDLNDQPRH